MTTGLMAGKAGLFTSRKNGAIMAVSYAATYPPSVPVGGAIGEIH